MQLAATLFGHHYQFRDVKDVLAKANEEKSGDQLAGIAAESAAERMAARFVLSELTLETLRQNPAVPYDEDEVTRVIDDAVNETVYAEIQGMQVGELREWLLADTTTEEMIKRLSNGLTSEMVAAVTKLMSNLDLMLAASKIRVVKHATNTIGLPGTLGSRCQPNNQTDSVEGIRAAIYEGLSFGSGDSVIGINPSDDSLGSVAQLLEMTYEVITRWEIPTQNCVLAHVSTQMEAMRKGAPVGLVFQSLAGSQKGNESFGDQRRDARRGLRAGEAVLRRDRPELHVLRDRAGRRALGRRPQRSRPARHGGALLRVRAPLRPVPAQHRGRLHRTRVPLRRHADHPRRPRGPLHGQAQRHLDGRRRLLHQPRPVRRRTSWRTSPCCSVRRACNYIMGIPMGDDSMLSYQSSSYHDAPSLRQLLHLRPLPEFEAWMEGVGLLRDGRLTEKAGDASFFLSR